jgi:hypothetical protein
MTNAERKNHYSFNLGDVAGTALEEMAKKLKVSKSSIVRDCLVLCYQTSAFRSFENLRKQMESDPVLFEVKKAKKKTKSTTASEQMVIDKYREVFNYTGRIFNPAVLAVIRSAKNGGVEEETLCELLEVCPNDSLVAQRITRGEHIPLNELLTEKMISRLLPMLDAVERDDADKEVMYLEGTIKPGAYRTLLDALDSEAFAVAWNLVSQAPSEKEVDRLVGLALENQLDSYLASVAEDIEEGTDHAEES